MCPATFSSFCNLPADGSALHSFPTMQHLRHWGKTVISSISAAQQSKESLLQSELFCDGGVLWYIQSAVIQNKHTFILWKIRLEQLHFQLPQSVQSSKHLFEMLRKPVANWAAVLTLSMFLVLCDDFKRSYIRNDQQCVFTAWNV